MTDWKRIVEAHHAWAHPNGDYRLVMQDPASEADLASLRSLFGNAMTHEVEELYSQLNGFGIADSSDKISWFVVPIAKLPEIFHHCRGWFNETHPELANRFFPFVDWSCGDYSGILLSEDGSALSEIFMFEHEGYEFEKDQDDLDFLYPADYSLEEFLGPPTE